MQSFQPITLVFAGSVFFVSSVSSGQDASDSKPERTEEVRPLAEYLQRAAVKLDCYFTIEEMTREEGDNWIQNTTFKPKRFLPLSEKTIEKLSALLKGVHIYQKKQIWPSSISLMTD